MKRNSSRHSNVLSKKNIRTGVGIIAGSLLSVAVIRYLSARITDARNGRRRSMGGGIKTGPAAPSEINLDARFGNENERDIVDQASWESFPASDPPAY